MNTIKVKELIKILEQYPEHADVVFEKNSFNKDYQRTIKTIMAINDFEYDKLFNEIRLKN